MIALEDFSENSLLDLQLVGVADVLVFTAATAIKDGTGRLDSKDGWLDYLFDDRFIVCFLILGNFNFKKIAWYRFAHENWAIRFISTNAPSFVN